MALFPKIVDTEKFEQEKQDYEKRIASLGEEVQRYQARESTVVSALAEAEKLAKARVAAADEQAAVILAAAETERNETEAARLGILEQAEQEAKAIKDEANAMGDEIIQEAIQRVDTILDSAHGAIREAISFSANLIKSLRLMSIQAEEQAQLLSGALQLLESRRSLLDYSPQLLERGGTPSVPNPVVEVAIEAERIWTIEDLAAEETSAAKLDEKLSDAIADVIN